MEDLILFIPILNHIVCSLWDIAENEYVEVAVETPAFRCYQRASVEQLMHAIGSSSSVLTSYLSLAPEMKRRTWIMESCPVKVSMTGLELGKVKFLASRFERHNIKI